MRNVRNSFAGMLALCCSIAFTSCSTGVHVGNSNSAGRTSVAAKNKRVPPGQAKKRNGDKSAKRYAPGQQQ